MKKKRIVTWGLVLALLCASCGSGGQSSFSGSGGSSSSGEVEKSESPPKPEPSVSAQLPQTADTSQEVKELVWTTEPVLSEAEMPGNYSGLELPVVGATGYTSVELPLWENVEDSEAARKRVEEWEKLQEEKRLQEEEKKRQEEEKRLQEEQAAAAYEAEQAGTDDPSAVPEADGSSSSSPEQPLEADESENTPEEPSPNESGTAQDPPLSSEEPSAPVEPDIPEAPNIPEEPEEPEEPAEQPTLTDGSLAVLKPGAAFTILRESGKWWRVRCEADYIENGQKRHGTLTGWVEHRHCMINLPDVIPSMVYDDTNGYSSVFISCGRSIDGITGKALYQGSLAYNPRLKEEEFMMPVLYAMASRLCAAQRAALERGNTLVLYEGYRPYFVQTMVSKALSAMMQKDPDMKQEVAGAPWNIS